MTYSFRIRCKLPQHHLIGIESERWQFKPQNLTHEISLRSTNHDTLISKSTDLIFGGDGYSSEDIAHSEAKVLKDSIIIAFARLHIGVDFGDRAPKVHFTDYFKQAYGNPQIFINEHGIMIFDTNQPPNITEFDSKLKSMHGKERFTEAMEVACRLKYKISDEHRIAFDLFSASFEESSSDARLLMLMMGVETLIEPAQRSMEAISHVQNLIEQTKQSCKLSSVEKNSMLGSLLWLKKESISQAGRKLASKLGQKKYHDMDPPKFFTFCYDLRSNLIHGRIPRPTREEVGIAAANLETFLGDLLSLPLLDNISL